jgi:hypothetical protein
VGFEPGGDEAIETIPPEQPLLVFLSVSVQSRLGRIDVCVELGAVHRLLYGICRMATPSGLRTPADLRQRGYRRPYAPGVVDDNGIERVRLEWHIEMSTRSCRRKSQET